MLIYYALAYPYIIYGNLIWNNTYKTRMQKIMNIQKKIERLMTFKSYVDLTQTIFEELSILYFFKINNFLTTMFMFWYHRLNNLPEEFDHFLTRDQIHQHNTWNSNTLYKWY